MEMEHRILENAITDVLKTCYDPEIPVNIFALGLIYKISIDEHANAHVLMTLTSPNCPVAESLPAEVEGKLKGIAGMNSVKVEITFEPPWDMSMMSEEAKLELGMM